MTSTAFPTSVRGTAVPLPSRDDGHSLIAADGRRLAASWFEPPAGEARAVALISPATGVRPSRSGWPRAAMRY
jgi:hypothetical protein